MKELVPEFHHTERLPENAQEFLRWLSSGEPAPEGLGLKTAIIGAHQDDESIAYARPLLKLPDSLVIHVTDGAPLDAAEWKGSPTREAYAHIRERESDIALDIVGHEKNRRVPLQIPDQQSAFRLTEIARRLASEFRAKGIRFALTHAYEGGHPDHDATTFAVHAAKKILAQEGYPISIIEAPLYRIEGGDSIRQSFVPYTETRTYKAELTADEVAYKTRMYDAYRSQHETIFNRGLPNKMMSSVTEWYREAPNYRNFSELPNAGNLSSIYKNAGISAEKWLELAKSAVRDLEI